MNDRLGSSLYNRDVDTSPPVSLMAITRSLRGRIAQSADDDGLCNFITLNPSIRAKVQTG